MVLTSEEINIIVYKYLQESGNETTKKKKKKKTK